MCDFLSEWSDCTSVFDYRHYDRHGLSFLSHCHTKTLTEAHTRKKNIMIMENCFAYLQLSNVLKEICSTPELTIYSHYLKLRKKSVQCRPLFI